MKYLQKETVIAYLITFENSQKEIDPPQHLLFLFRTFTGYINRYREVSFIEPLLSVSCFFLNKKV